MRNATDPKFHTQGLLVRTIMERVVDRDDPEKEPVVQTKVIVKIPTMQGAFDIFKNGHPELEKVGDAWREKMIAMFKALGFETTFAGPSPLGEVMEMQLALNGLSADLEAHIMAHYQEAFSELLGENVEKWATALESSRMSKLYPDYDAQWGETNSDNAREKRRNAKASLEQWLSAVFAPTMAPFLAPLARNERQNDGKMGYVANLDEGLDLLRERWLGAKKEAAAISARSSNLLRVDAFRTGFDLETHPVIAPWAKNNEILGVRVQIPNSVVNARRPVVDALTEFLLTGKNPQGRTVMKAPLPAGEVSKTEDYVASDAKPLPGGKKPRNDFGLRDIKPMREILIPCPKGMEGARIFMFMKAVAEMVTSLFPDTLVSDNLARHIMVEEYKQGSRTLTIPESSSLHKFPKTLLDFPKLEPKTDEPDEASPEETKREVDVKNEVLPFSSQSTIRVMLTEENAEAGVAILKRMAMPRTGELGIPLVSKDDMRIRKYDEQDGIPAHTVVYLNLGKETPEGLALHPRTECARRIVGELAKGGIDMALGEPKVSLFDAVRNARLQQGVPCRLLVKIPRVTERAKEGGSRRSAQAAEKSATEKALEHFEKALKEREWADATSENERTTKTYTINISKETDISSIDEEFMQKEHEWVLSLVEEIQGMGLNCEFEEFRDMNAAQQAITERITQRNLAGFIFSGVTEELLGFKPELRSLGLDDLAERLGVAFNEDGSIVGMDGDTSDFFSFADDEEYSVGEEGVAPAAQANVFDTKEPEQTQEDTQPEQEAEQPEAEQPEPPAAPRRGSVFNHNML